MKTHVTLIRPSVLFPKFRPSAAVKPIAPLGLAYIAGAIREAGFGITCIDAPGEALSRLRICELDPSLLENGLNIQEVVERIPQTTSVIGISVMFSFDWFYVRELIRAIRARFPASYIVLGGEHATADHDYVLRTTPEVDACVLGEGENKIVGLLQAFEDGVPRRDLPGAAIFDRETKAVRKNPSADGRYRIRDVDSISRPAWDLLPLKEYLNFGSGHGSLNERAMPMLASRGCPYQCTFCSSPQMWTTKWKARNIDDVFDEIKNYIRDFGINRIEFYDLTVIVDGKWILEFCRRLREENLGISWALPSGTRTEALTEEVLRAIRESGCVKLTYPLESGNPKINKLIKKRINYKHSLASMRAAVNAGIIVKSTTIIGLPFHTWKDVFIEYLFALRLAWIGASDIAFFSFAPYPGSELHDQLVRDGKIIKDENYPAWLRKVFPANFTNGSSWCPAFSASTVRYLCLLGMAQFYLFQYLIRPQRLFYSLYRIFSGRPLTTLELGLTGTVQRAIQRRRILLLGRSGQVAGA
ncbi:MAG: radical SAM protein [Bdellovibrionia bacterium]